MQKGADETVVQIEANPNLSGVVFRRMTLSDLDQVMSVEHQAFSAPWSRQAFISELVDNQLARYYVAEYQGQIIGYAGIWLIVDEGHVTNIAVHPEYRGLHLGESLLLTLMGSCRQHSIRRITLEVRVSNHVARNLYEKFGFTSVGVRKGYYTDNNEDAIIMWANVPAKPEIPPSTRR